MRREWIHGMIVILLTGLCLVTCHRNCAAAALKIDANERLLVFAPHPDDEVLGCGGLMQRVKALGGKVGVVYVTAGDGCISLNPFVLVNGKKIHRKLGYKRFHEALLAMECLNVSKDDIAFLGYPDRGLITLWSIRDNPYQEYRSRMTGYDYVFYRGSTCQGLSYDCESLVNSLKLAIEHFNPTIVLIPSAWDHHPDHRATNYFVKTALKRKKSSPRILSYLVHYKSWPVKKRFNKSKSLPKSLLNNRCELWLVPTECQCKFQAMEAYRSQYPQINHIFSSFASDEEVFWREDLEIIEYTSGQNGNRWGMEVEEANVI